MLPVVCLISWKRWQIYDWNACVIDDAVLAAAVLFVKYDDERAPQKCVSFIVNGDGFVDVALAMMVFVFVVTECS